MVWLFNRNGERLRYEIRHAATGDAYELALTFPDGRTQTQHTADAAELLDLCADLARTLRDDGWHAPHQLDESNQSAV